MEKRRRIFSAKEVQVTYLALFPPEVAHNPPPLSVDVTE